MNTHTLVVVYKGNGTEEKALKKKKVFKEDLKKNDRNSWELVPDNRSLVRKRVLGYLCCVSMSPLITFDK